MYLKVEVNGELEELLKGVWPNHSDEQLYRDYENEYEWAWVYIPEFDFWLNVSRAHDWGEEENNYPLYISAFSSDIVGSQRVENIPNQLSTLISNSLSCDVCLHEGNYIVDSPEQKLIATVSPET